MILHLPFQISARLLPAVRIGDKSSISIEFSKRPGTEGRVRYCYHIDTPDFEYTNDDLQSGCGGGSLQQGLESLLSFLSAAGEAHYWRERTASVSENESLFPPNVAEWAYRHDTELSCLQLELEENRNLITR